MNDLKFYAVRNKEGKWFRRKGYGGSGDSWVDEITKARIYNKIGTARAQISWWFTNYPSFGCPDLVVFSIQISAVINEEDRLLKKRAKKEKAAVITRLRMAERDLEKAREGVLRAKKTVENLSGKKEL